MTTEGIWCDFVAKLKTDSLSEDDCVNDNKSFLIPFLTGESRRFFRDKVIDADVCFDTGETKHIVTADCADGQFRFDFIVQEDEWRLCSIECITIPIKSIVQIPYADFPSMPEYETWIRAEKNISRNIYLYCRLQECFGRDEAIKWFLDGAGESLAARSWIPFFNDGKASVAYLAWCENRINGEKTSIEEFSDHRCVIRLNGHLWFRVYNCASHLRLMISEKEYRELFEYIWLDRGKQSGWKVTFNYIGSDTEIIFEEKD